MTVAELAAHYHLPNTLSGGFVLNAYNNAPTGNYAGTAYVGSGGLFNIWGGSTNSVGDSQPFNVLNPYIVSSLAVRV